jgi:uncharacterized membrane protein
LRHQSKSPSDRGIEEVAHLEREAYQSRSRVDHLAAVIIRFAGTGTAILAHVVWFTLWLLFNIGGVAGLTPFDPFPFNLLTTIVSIEAIFLTLFVLITQNEMSRQADKRAELDLQINILAEKEATMILRMLQEISKRLDLKGPAGDDIQELLKETKVEELAKKLEGALPPK